jgi:hypothetical protein
MINHPSSLGIALGSNEIRICRQERLDFDLQITDMFFGPFEFYADKRESVFGTHDEAGYITNPIGINSRLGD